MEQGLLLNVLERLERGELDATSAFAALSGFPSRPMARDLGFAKVDLDRLRRQGVSEVVFGETKSAEQIIAICSALLEAEQPVLVTRVSAGKAEDVRLRLPQLDYRDEARALLFGAPKEARRERIVVVCAGTSDIPVAEEAATTLSWAGFAPERLYDVGVAGIHRLLRALPLLESADAVIAVAGMEGALPSVLGGLVEVPVIAVPVSVGYGAALSGFTALLGMLTGCAAGTTVVNIDNGFGAAMAVIRMMRRGEART